MAKLPDGEEVYECPKSAWCKSPEAFGSVFRYFRWYQKGHFPNEGGWRDQVPAFVTAMELIEGAMGTARHELEQAAADKAKRRGGPNKSR